MNNFYDLNAKTLDGKAFSFDACKGKKVLIVNTASECGFTPQHQQLQELHEALAGKEAMIIGVPCNDFGKQEPGSASEIAQFCQKNYGVSFLMLEKVNIISEPIHPLYNWLTNESENGISDAEVKWNFHKFLIDGEGQWVKSLASAISPLDEQVMNFFKL